MSKTAEEEIKTSNKEEEENDIEKKRMTNFIWQNIVEKIIKIKL